MPSSDKLHNRTVGALIWWAWMWLAHCQKFIYSLWWTQSLELGTGYWCSWKVAQSWLQRIVWHCRSLETWPKRGAYWIQYTVRGFLTIKCRRLELPDSDTYIRLIYCLVEWAAKLCNIIVQSVYSAVTHESRFVEDGELSLRLAHLHQRCRPVLVIWPLPLEAVLKQLLRDSSWTVNRACVPIWITVTIRLVLVIVH